MRALLGTASQFCEEVVLTRPPGHDKVQAGNLWIMKPLVGKGEQSLLSPSRSLPLSLLLSFSPRLRLCDSNFEVALLF